MAGDEGIPWPQLPDDILNRILSRLNLRDHVRLGATCRFLQEYAMIDNPPCFKSICWVPSDDPRHLLNRFLSGYGGPEQPDPTEGNQIIDCVGFFQRWLVIAEAESRSIHIVNRILKAHIQLPELVPGLPIRKALLSADPRFDECLVAALDGNRDAFLCRPRQPDARWVRYSEDVDFDPFDPLHPCFNDVTLHGSRLWASLGRWNLIVKISLNVQEPSAWWTRRGSTFLVACDDKVWAANFIRSRFDVWELGGSVLFRWRDLEGGALLLSWHGRGAIVPAEEMSTTQFERDSIYLLHQQGGQVTLFQYDPATHKFEIAGNLHLVGGSILASYFQYIRQENLLFG